jgi:PIN domain nuclease of toxin-antitoxin system
VSAGGTETVTHLVVGDRGRLAHLRSLTRAAGLSLADRACLALVRRRGGRALTADAAWGDVSAGVELIQIR